MASSLDHWTGWGRTPAKLLYSYLDLNGNPTECYTYAVVIDRTKAIAGHLLKDGRFVAEDRLLLAYPPGLEMICAFFGCVRAGLIPVPVYPPVLRGFQERPLQNGSHCKGLPGRRGLNEQRLHASLKTNLARSGVAASGVDVTTISGLPWIVTGRLFDTISDTASDESFIETSKILFLQYTSGSDDGAQGCDLTHENILDTYPLVIDHPEPVVVSWLPQYHDMGLIGCYLYPALKGGTTYGFASMDFISAQPCGSTP